MFRWRSPFLLSLRLLQIRSLKTEPLLVQLKRCKTKYQVFQLLGMNRSALTVHHVGYVFNLLQYFQEGDPEKSRTFYQIRDNPEFAVLCTLAQNNVDRLEDQELVDILQTLISFQLEAHNPLIQQLVIEGWRRLERLDLRTLANFAECLRKQDLNASPLVGQIANIVDKKLEDADDPISLSCLLASLQAVSSPRLQERLIRKIESSMHNFDVSGIQHAFRVIRIFYQYKFTYVSLLEKYDNFFKQNIDAMDAINLASITSEFQQLQLNNSVFPLIAKPRLIEMVDTCNDPSTFIHLFTALSRMNIHHLKDRLEEKLLTFLDELDLIQLLVVLKAMLEAECNSDALIQKIFQLLQKHLDICKPLQLLYITEALVKLSSQKTTLLKGLQRHLQRNLIASFVPFDVATLAHALSLLKLCSVDEAVLSKIDAIMPQCNLPNMEKIAFLLLQLIKEPSGYDIHYKTCKDLFQKMNRCTLERLRHMDNINLILEEVLYIKTKRWINKEIAMGLSDTCQRLLHSITWKNVPKLSILLLQINYAQAPLLHTVAAVTLEDIAKIHPSLILTIVRSFTILNYEPPQGRAFFDICLQHVLNHKDLLSPSRLMQVCHNLILTEYFSKELIDLIFNITFLRRLDDQLNSLPCEQAMYFRHCLMELNRAVCLEHPEYQVPWFHEPFCQQMKKKEQNSINTWLQEVLEETLGGKHYTKFLVTTPYFYSIDLEFTLDKDKKPIPYEEQESVSEDTIKKRDRDVRLPEGAQRFAVDLLHAVAYCQDTHLKGPHAMKKRHLELIGYQVIQIPVFEWLSLRGTAKESQIQYLTRKIDADH
ncbi:FAST kinase domain-containing protein 1, mitochondrial isoform X1 [Eleutherodactylus coqui]|uniref:FAST kinase domain-containing protein 1, mitochondrial isoform X1 n=1 Tax=Eleutherodactylus coqui TaxID=57060 RepID=UPI0034630C59